MRKPKNFRELSEIYLPEIERRAAELLPEKQKFTPLLNKALRYVLKTGGKRIRPLIFIASYRAFRNKISKGEEEKMLSFACGLEFIHNYSLIHDDIMDGDDVRRGFKTVHRKFGESIAILAGDALLTRGLEVLYENFPRAAKIVNRKIGIPGMVSGQAADIESEGKSRLSKAALFYTHTNKTAAFISAAAAAGALAAGAPPRAVKIMAEYGENVGVAFQIRDDLLDRIGKKSKYKKSRTDEKNKKMTILSFFSVDGAENLVKEFSEMAANKIKKLSSGTILLEEIVGLLISREK